ncbi:hypothetical protein PspLS_12012 [Pyricularia sp. CBS 133598]|nr:hypothetical protein PspLS_12012 [Pyricularia sp. CBS 133598]
MRFTVAATAALLGAAIAAPAPQRNPDPRETISIQNFEAINKNQNNDGPVTSVYFEIFSHREAGVAAFVCKAEAAEGLNNSDIFDCYKGPLPNDAYAFKLVSTADNTFNLKIYHQTAPAFGLLGDVSVEGQCSAESGVSTCRKDQTVAELHVN